MKYGLATLSVYDGEVNTRMDSRKGEGKGKVHPGIGHEGPEEEWRYSRTLSLTLELYGVGVQRHAPADLPPGKRRYPSYGRLGGKISPSPGFDPRTFHPAASRCTD